MTAYFPPPSTSESREDPAKREEQARALCLRLLTARARTRAELEAQLVHTRRANAGKGKRALAAELRTKGVDDEVINGVLADIDAGAERQRAEELVRNKLRRERLDDGDAVKVMRRLVAMLARRGYSQSMAFEVVNAELAAERERRRV